MGVRFSRTGFGSKREKVEVETKGYQATFAAPAANSENIPVKDAFPGLTSV